MPKIATASLKITNPFLYFQLLNLKTQLFIHLFRNTFDLKLSSLKYCPSHGLFTCILIHPADSKKKKKRTQSPFGFPSLWAAMYSCIGCTLHNSRNHVDSDVSHSAPQFVQQGGAAVILDLAEEIETPALTCASDLRACNSPAQSWKTPQPNLIIVTSKPVLLLL